LTAVRWLRSGKLKAQKFGRKTVRMKASDLDAFINQQRPSLSLVQPPDVMDGIVALCGLVERLRPRWTPEDRRRVREVLTRELRALEAQDAQGPSPMAGDTPHPAQYKATMLARLRAMKAEGLSLQAMADRLNSEGVPSLRGSRWQKGTIGNMLAQG
jgi:hypothetical protein